MCACVVRALLATPDIAPQALAQKKDPKKKDPDHTRFLKQLHKKFEAWDKNNDNVLDKSELAKASRGASAKPFDYQDSSIAPTTRIVRPVSVMLASLPRPGLVVNMALAEFFTERKPVKFKPVIDYTTFGDYQFIVLVGTKGEKRVTKQEFDSWANKYARLVDDHEDAEKQFAQAKAKFAKAKTPQEKKKADAEHC